MKRVQSAASVNFSKQKEKLEGKKKLLRIADDRRIHAEQASPSGQAHELPLS